MDGLTRSEVLTAIDEFYADSPIILTLGGTPREMRLVAGTKSNHFIMLDAMGQAPAVGLGVALARDSERGPVVAVEGDGSLLMGLSVLSTVGLLSPANFILFVLDNAVYLATGGQPTASPVTDFAAIATACGWPTTSHIRSRDELQDGLELTRKVEGPFLFRVFVNTESPEAPYILEDPVKLGIEFQMWMRDDPEKRYHHTN